MKRKKKFYTKFCSKKMNFEGVLKIKRFVNVKIAIMFLSLKCIKLQATHQLQITFLLDINHLKCTFRTRNHVHII